MVTDEERVFHRAGRNRKRLDDKGDDEQPRRQHCRERGRKLDRSFLRLLFHDVFRFLIFLRHSVSPCQLKVICSEKLGINYFPERHLANDNSARAYDIAGVGNSCFDCWRHWRFGYPIIWYGVIGTLWWYFLSWVWLGLRAANEAHPERPK